MQTPPPALQTQIASSQTIEHLHLSAIGAHQTVADQSNLDQLAERATTMTPQLLALLAESGHGESVLND